MAQVWLITGSARGLGRAIAEAVLAAGDKLIATARHPQQLSDLVARYGDHVRAVALDVTDERAAIAAVHLAVDVFGRLDVLVNNAGYGNLAAIEDTTMQDFRAQLETNLFGVVNLTKAAIPVMRRQGAGRILQFSSVGGRVGPIGRGAYAAAKCDVGGFSEVLAKKVGPLGIKVTIIEPGGFRTDFAGSSQTILAGNPAYSASKAFLHSWLQSLRCQLRKTSVEELELIPPYTQTELSGPAQATDPRAVPLEQFVADVMRPLGESTSEIIVDEVRESRWENGRGSTTRYPRNAMRGPANARARQRSPPSSIRRRIPRRLTRFEKGDTYEESSLAHYWELSRSRPCARRSGSRCGTQARRYRTESEAALAAGRALRRPGSRGSSRRNRRARRGGSDPNGSRLVRPSRRARQ